MESVYLVVGKIVVWGACWIIANIAIVRLCKVCLDGLERTLDRDGLAFDWTMSVADTLDAVLERIRGYLHMSGHSFDLVMEAVVGAWVSPLLLCSALLELFCIHPIRRRVRARRHAAPTAPSTRGA